MEEIYVVLVHVTHYKQNTDLFHKEYSYYPSKEEIDSAIKYYRDYDYKGSAKPVIHYAKVEKRYVAS